jgi:hypothetical protein
VIDPGVGFWQTVAGNFFHCWRVNLVLSLNFSATAGRLVALKSSLAAV